ncbi:MAG TPA: hypothetical protein VL461_14355 [Dictyobacter sp.]|jgi:hypothetical protein|nr:hypothetical protein [Dictyobacter sp.]
MVHKTPTRGQNTPSPRQAGQTWWHTRSAFIQRASKILLSCILALILLYTADLLPEAKLFLPPNIKPLAGNNLFYFQTLPAWGTISIDGHPQSHLPTITQDLPLTLAQGTHQITWHAAPFQDMSCTITVPPAKEAQTCPTQQLVDNNQRVHQATLVLPPQHYSLDTLPDAQRQALITTVQNTLDTLQSTATVQPGEPYLIEDRIQIAQSQLKATQRFVLDIDTSRPTTCNGVRLGDSCNYNGQDCRRFCTIAWPEAISDQTPPHWDIAAIFHPQWSYTPTQKNTSGSLQNSMPAQFVTLHITWHQNTWQATFHPPLESSFDDPNCITTISTLVQNTRYQPEDGYHWVYISGHNRASGCIAIQQRTSANTLQPLAADDIMLIDRFGVLLAGNTATARRWSDLPRASMEVLQQAQASLRHPAFLT